jgi:hypothetical protein
MVNDEIVESGMGELRDRLGKVERGLAENTATTKRIESDTTEMVELFRSWKGAMAVLEVIGKAAKPLAAIATLAAAIGAWWFNWRIGK